MRIQDTDRRERNWSYLQQATGENTKSGAIDTAVPTGAIPELLEQGEQEGSLTVEQIAAILDTDKLPVDAEVSWSVGDE